MKHQRKYLAEITVFNPTLLHKKSPEKAFLI